MPKEYLKTSYKWQLRTAAVFNIAVFWSLVVSQADISTVPALLSTISLKDGLIATISPIACFVLDGLMSADLKARTIYWRWRNPLPGSQAFSRHLHREPRANPERLAAKWGPFPEDPNQQNRLWYTIYKSVEDEIRVHEAHRSSLYSRDLAAYAVLFLTILGSSTIIIGTPWPTASLYLAFLTLQYLGCISAARTYGVRFVRTVLAIASTSDSPPDDTN